VSIGRFASFCGLIRRLPSIAAVVVAIASMLVVQWQEGPVVHVRCETHGELMHLGSESSSVHGGQDSEAPVSEHHLRQSTGGQAVAHDHCDVLQSTYSTVASIAPTIAITDGAALLAVPVATPSARLPRATFRIAPKTSPPA